MIEALKRHGDGAGAWILAGIVALGIFALDLALPLGVADGVLYVAPVLIATFSRNPKYILGLAAMTSVLIVLGYQFSPHGGVGWVVIANRGISLFAVGSVAVVAYNWRRVDQEHRKSEARYRDLIESSILPIQIYSPDSKYSYANRAFLDLFGYESTEEVFEFQGKTIAPHHRAKIVSQSMARDRGENVPSVYEFDIVRKDGGFVPVQAYVRTFEWEGVMAKQRILVDMTERNKAEAAVRELNRTLERRVAERSRELHDVQRELIRKERLAALGQLTATVSHELRNPLGTIRNSTYVLRELIGDSDERLLRAVERIDRNIDRSTAIIQELSDFTRVTERELVPTEVNRWLDDVLDALPAPDGVTLVRRFDAADLVAPIDPDYLNRAVINLYDNGCQAMLNRSPESDKDAENILTVSTLSAGDRVGISFRDTGPGISEDVRDRIFEPLYSTKAFGVGLGLCIVKQIIEQHEGNIEIVSREGEGAEMILWLHRGKIARVA